MRSIDPKDLETGAFHGLLLSTVAPRPIAFASTIDAEGRPNLAPFSFFNVFSSNPPIAIFSPARRVRGNTTKHTLDNVEAVKEVVINVVNYDLVQQMNLASTEYPEGVNEFGKAGLTPIASDLVRPFRVMESPVQFECKVREVIKLGDEGGAGNLIVAEILRMHISEDVMTEEGGIDPHRLDLVARMGGDWYCRASGDAIFSIAKPGREHGIGVDAMPEHIRESSILSGNDLGLLGGIHQLPTFEELEAFRADPKMAALIKWQHKNHHEVEKQLHQNAQMLLAEGRIKEAWMMLLALE
ncbi:MAG: flavin reductase family protein [Flavobacteriales bacterium]|nr:flavin reductase family protein [Flavobacteriales bacterium]